MSAWVRHWIEWIGSFGHLARMVVFGLVGVFLIKAAIDYNPNTAVGLDGTLATLGHQSYGPFLLGLVAAGLVASASTRSATPATAASSLALSRRRTRGEPRSSASNGQLRE